MHDNRQSNHPTPRLEFDDNLNHVFVYGTLKRGECRERCWPLPPYAVQSAWTLGELFDTGPYPALLLGSDCVAGELWSYRTADISHVQDALDIVEGTNQPGVPNQYDRVPITAYLLDGTPVLAEVYVYAMREDIPTFVRIPPWLIWQQEQYAAWPAGRARWPSG